MLLVRLSGPKSLRIAVSVSRSCPASLPDARLCSCSPVRPQCPAHHAFMVITPDALATGAYDWVERAGIRQGRLFRRVCRRGTVWGSEITEKVVWHLRMARPFSITSNTSRRPRTNRQQLKTYNVSAQPNTEFVVLSKHQFQGFTHDTKREFDGLGCNGLQNESA